MNQLISLGELAIEMRVNKSQLLYYYKMGLLKPVETVGRMNLFNKKDTIEAVKKIKKFKKTNKSLREIKELL